MAVTKVTLTGEALRGVAPHLLSFAELEQLPQEVCLGRIRPLSHPPALKFSAYFDPAGITTPPPASTNWRQKAAASIARMYRNDVQGCCVPPGTLVHMADGSCRPIEKVMVTEQVRTAEGNTGPVAKVVTRYVNEPLVRIVAWGHSHLRMTHEHPVLTRRGYVPASDLVEHDWIALPARKTCSKTTVNTADLLAGVELYGVAGNASRRGYTASVAAQRKAITTAVASLPETLDLTPALGRLLGLFLAEGSTNGRVVCFTFSRDERETLVQETVELLRSEFGAEPSLSERLSAIEVRASGKVLCYLFRHMCGVGAAGKCLHPLLHDGPQDFLQAIFDGWMDGDGHTRRGERAGVTVSHELALDMFNIAQTLGLEPTITTRAAHVSRAPNGPNGELVSINGRQSWCVTVTEKRIPDGVSADKRRLGYWYAWGRTDDGRSKNLGSFASRDEAAAAAADHRASQFGMTKRVMSEDGIVWRRVRRTEREPYSGYVFNLEVTGDNSYVAEGVGVHNCVISGKAHALGVWSGNDSDSGGIILATDAEIDSQYVGICGPGDHGCVITDVLDVMRSRGFLAGGKHYKIDGYVHCDWTNQLEVKVIQQVFGASTIGINLPKDWLSNAVWDVTTSPIVGGHDVTCFTGDTKVSLLDGTERTLRELSEGVAGEKFWVYSCDSEGNVVPGLAHSARKTGVDRQLVRVILDNGEQVRCTPDHRFMLRDGTYREAKDLQSGDSLMPLYRRLGTKQMSAVRRENIKKANAARLANNHKVVSVVPDGREDVYDLTVDKHHNFALSSGVFVHNCIDYDEKGVYVSSWGRIYLITWAAFLSKTWLEEYYAILAPAWYNSDKLAPNGIDFATLSADLQKLNGGIIPDPGPIQPPPVVCPQGTHYDPVSQQCVPDVPTPPAPVGPTLAQALATIDARFAYYAKQLPWLRGLLSQMEADMKSAFKALYSHHADIEVINFDWRKLLEELLKKILGGL